MRKFSRVRVDAGNHTSTHFNKSSSLQVEGTRTDECNDNCRISEESVDIPAGWLLTRVRAISARVNKNFDGFTSAELKKAYSTFEGKPVFVNHVNHDVNRARGRVAVANYHEHGKDKYIECFMLVDGNAYPKLAKELREDNLDSVSMGCDIVSSRCSISSCRNEAKNQFEFCEHILNKKGQMVDGELVFEECLGLSFFELSYVFDPADETAVMQSVHVGSKTSSLIWREPLPGEHFAYWKDANTGIEFEFNLVQGTVSNYSGPSAIFEVNEVYDEDFPFSWLDDVEVAKSSMVSQFSDWYATQYGKRPRFGSLALEDTVSPLDVDTLRTEEMCPECGTDDFDGKECDECGYVPPIDELSEPDVNAVEKPDVKEEPKDEEKSDEDEEEVEVDEKLKKALLARRLNRRTANDWQEVDTGYGVVNLIKVIREDGLTAKIDPEPTYQGEYFWRLTKGDFIVYKAGTKFPVQGYSPSLEEAKRESESWGDPQKSHLIAEASSSVVPLTRASSMDILHKAYLLGKDSNITSVDQILSELGVNLDDPDTSLEEMEKVISAFEIGYTNRGKHIDPSELVDLSRLRKSNWSYTKRAPARRNKKADRMDSVTNIGNWTLTDDIGDEPPIAGDLQDIADGLHQWFIAGTSGDAGLEKAMEDLLYKAHRGEPIHAEEEYLGVRLVRNGSVQRVGFSIGDRVRDTDGNEGVIVDIDEMRSGTSYRVLFDNNRPGDPNSSRENGARVREEELSKLTWVSRTSINRRLKHGGKQANYVVRVIWEGELLSQEEFSSENEAYDHYDQMIEVTQQEGDPSGTSVQIIDGDYVIGEQHFARSKNMRRRANEPAHASLFYELEDIISELSSSSMVPPTPVGQFSSDINMNAEDPGRLIAIINSFLLNMGDRIPSNNVEDLRDIANELQRFAKSSRVKKSSEWQPIGDGKWELVLGSTTLTITEKPDGKFRAQYSSPAGAFLQDHQDFAGAVKYLEKAYEMNPDPQATPSYRTLDQDIEILRNKRY